MGVLGHKHEQKQKAHGLLRDAVSQFGFVLTISKHVENRVKLERKPKFSSGKKKYTILAALSKDFFCFKKMASD